MSELTDDQIAEARRMWADGHTLADIIAALPCPLYALSPWLYTEDTPINAKYRELLAGRSTHRTEETG